MKGGCWKCGKLTRNAVLRESPDHPGQQTVTFVCEDCPTPTGGDRVQDQKEDDDPRRTA